MKLIRYAGLLTIIIAASMLIFAGCGSSSKSSRSSTGTGTDTGTGTGTGTGTSTGYDPGSNPENASANEQSVYSIVNAERETAGVDPTKWCNGLYDLAKGHANDMCDRDYYDHTNPEGEDPSARGRAGHAGAYTFTPVVSNPYSTGIAECINYGPSAPQDNMTMWMESSGHRAIIIGSSSNYIGVGQCNGCGRHWVLCFGIGRN